MTTTTNSNPTVTPILARLAAALEAKTNAAIGQLASLETAILEAFEDAEAEAQQRIDNMADAIHLAIGQRLDAFETRVLDLAGDAVGQSIHDLGQRLDDLFSVNGKPVPIEAQPVVASPEEIIGQASAEPTPESEPITTPQDDLPAEQTTALGGDILKPLALEQHDYPLAIPVAQEAGQPMPVAAQVLERERPAVLPQEDDADQTDDGQDDEDDLDAYAVMAGPADGIITTCCRDGLHERRGQGKQTRYHLVEFPEPGQRYFARDGKKWVEVRYLGEL